MTCTGILVDTYAWLEIMSGSSKGNHAQMVIQENSHISISVLTIYELRYRLEQIKDNESAVAIIRQITDQADVIPIDAQIAFLGGTIRIQTTSQKTPMGAVDCLILATARIHNLKVLTGDIHFKGLEETILI